MSGRGNKKQSFINGNEKKWYVGCYTRRSFDDMEDEESNTITNQKRMINDYIKEYPNMKIVDTYVDDGYTGTNFNRPGFKEMLKDAKDGKINTIIVKDLSRLGRNHLEVGRYIEEVFPIYHIRIISVNDDIDSYLKPETINGLLTPIKNLINESYSRDISKKVSSAYQTMAKRGLYVAGTSPYGYKIDPNDKHHLVIDESEAKIVKEIFDMALNGSGRIKIVKYLNDKNILCRKEIQRRQKYNLAMDDSEKPKYFWGTTTIGRMLASEVYIGNLEQLKTARKSFKDHNPVNIDKKDWIRSENTHEPIISKELWGKVQVEVENRKYKKESSATFSPYNGFLKCGDCGKAMCKQEDHRGNRNVSNYYCNNYLRTNNYCSKHKIKSELLDTLVLEIITLQVNLVIELEKSLLKLNVFDNKSLDKQHKEIISNLENKIERLKNDKKNYYEEWKLNNIDKDEFTKKSDEILKKINGINEEINIVNSGYIEKLKRIKQSSYWIQHYKRNKKPKKVTKVILEELVECIYVYENSNVKIVFKYQDEYEFLLHYLAYERSGMECPNGTLVYI